MKLVVLSESPEDEAAVRILVDGILGSQTDHVAPPFLRTRGWSPLLSVLPGVLKQLHYHTDAEALVVIVDSDDSAPHQQAHPSPDAPSCRLCRLRALADQVQRGLTEVPNRAPLKTGFGLAVPSLEAWLRCGVDPHTIEAALIQRQDAGSRALRRQLKRDVYGTERPSQQVRMAHAVAEAQRLVQMIDEFERCFPDGVGSFARDVRSW
ncbi:MAG TPA: hypothetical protein VNS63_11155 [Blastocatellia bacterium]|nr:hypothetical protein [Blastocatellia bacterium]